MLPVKKKIVNNLNDEESKPKRWYEHFNEVLNRKNLINPVNMAR